MASGKDEKIEAVFLPEPLWSKNIMNLVTRYTFRRQPFYFKNGFAGCFRISIAVHQANQ